MEIHSTLPVGSVRVRYASAGLRPACRNVGHHVSDSETHSLLREAARVTMQEERGSGWRRNCSVGSMTRLARTKSGP
jgi:hypothetical protein